MPFTCPSCNSVVFEEDSYCKHCGQRMDLVKEAAQEAKTLQETEEKEEERRGVPPEGSEFLGRYGWFLFFLVMACRILPFSERLPRDVLLLPGYLLSIIVAYLVYRDGARNKVQNLKFSTLDLDWFDRRSPLAWAMFSFFLFPIFVPVYLIKRRKLVDAAYRTTVEGLYMSAEERVRK